MTDQQAMTLDIPGELYNNVAELSQQLGITIDQFIEASLHGFTNLSKEQQDLSMKEYMEKYEKAPKEATNQDSNPSGPTTVEHGKLYPDQSVNTTAS